MTALFSILPSSFLYAIKNLDAFAIAWILFAALIVIDIFIQLIFKSDKKVKMLKFDNGFNIWISETSILSNKID